MEDRHLDQPDFRIIGHRGARLHAPDNSDSGFHYLVNHDISWAETDLRLNSRGDIVLIHDPYLPDAGAVSDGEHPGLERLTAILDRYPALCLNLELKEPAVLERLCRLPALARQPERFILSSFHHGTVVSLKQCFPRIPCLIVVAGALIGLGEYVDRIRVDGVVFEYEFYDVPELDRILKSGKQAYAFTVNHMNDARRFRDMGINGIITDDPVALRSGLFPV